MHLSQSFTDQQNLICLEKASYMFDITFQYLIGPFSAGPFLTPTPLTPDLIPPVLKMRLTPIRAGVKRATILRSLA